MPSHERFEMRVPQDLLRRIDDWRKRQVIVPSRAAAVRYLLDSRLDELQPTPAYADELPQQ